MHSTARSPSGLLLHFLEVRPCGRLDIGPLLLFLIERVVVHGEASGDVDLFRKAAEGEIVFQRPMVSDKGPYRLPVVGLQACPPFVQCLLLRLAVTTEVTQRLPAAFWALPFLVIVTGNQAENGRRAVRHHVHVGDAGDGNRQLRRGIVAALEDAAEPPESLCRRH